MSIRLTAIVAHDPDAVLDYAMDWSAWLASGETISASSWTVVEGTATLCDAASGGTPAPTHAGSHTDDTTTIWIRSASAGDLVLRNRIVTSDGRQDDRTVTLRINQR